MEKPGYNTQGPIFVVGTPRSGTTLCAEILGRHSTIYTGGENHFFEDVYARRDQLGPLEAGEEGVGRVVERLLSIYGRYNQLDDQHLVDAMNTTGAVEAHLKAHCRSYAECLNAFMGLQMQRAGKRRWGNNTPKDIFHAGEILELFPTAKFVVCVRDLRDFMLSYRNRWRVTTPEHRERLRALYHPILTALLWKATVQRALSLRAAQGGGRVLLLRYEDLVAAPEKTVRRLCAFLGVVFEPSMLQVAGHNSSRHGEWGGIFTDSVGRWAKDLPPEEAWLGERVVGSRLIELGYVRMAEPVSWLRAAARAASFPAAALRALWSNRAVRGPLLPYLGKRMRGLVGGVR